MNEVELLEAVEASPAAKPVVSFAALPTAWCPQRPAPRLRR